MSTPACAGRDPEMWFPRAGQPQGEYKKQVRAAKLVCETCPVQRECLVQALADKEPSGIWGGLTAQERTRLREAIQEAANPEVSA